MAVNQQTMDIGDIITSWEVPEYDKHERSKRWYIISAAVFILLLLYSIFGLKFLRLDFSFNSLDFNPLFILIIIISTLVMIINDGQEPAMVKVAITDQGVVLGKNYYDYDEFKNFGLVYKPNQSLKNLYFEYKNSVRPRLSLPLLNMNPLPIRENLLRYLPEDLERTNLPLSETLAKLFKL